eukprot:13636830-Alexandrium_andersonii.AAC.1
MCIRDRTPPWRSWTIQLPPVIAAVKFLPGALLPGAARWLHHRVLLCPRRRLPSRTALLTLTQSLTAITLRPGWLHGRLRLRPCRSQSSLSSP